jgi:hypothetical protein
MSRPRSRRALARASPRGAPRRRDAIARRPKRPSRVVRRVAIDARRDDDVDAHRDDDVDAHRDDDDVDDARIVVATRDGVPRVATSTR